MYFVSEYVLYSGVALKEKQGLAEPQVMTQRVRERGNKTQHALAHTVSKNPDKEPACAEGVV